MTDEAAFQSFGALLRADTPAQDDDHARLDAILAAVDAAAPVPTGTLGFAVPAAVGAGAIAVYLVSRLVATATPRADAPLPSAAPAAPSHASAVVESPREDPRPLGISVGALPDAPVAPASQASAPSAPPSHAARETAAELFQRANALRDEGKAAEAQGVYGALRGNYPTSREARIATLSSAQLALAAGDPSRALPLFDAALTSLPELREEALVGRARALEALGRSAEARDAWRALLDAFPASSWKTHASARLRDE